MVQERVSMTSVFDSQALPSDVITSIREIRKKLRVHVGPFDNHRQIPRYETSQPDSRHDTWSLPIATTSHTSKSEAYR